jgi:hypothetical protein
VSQGCQIFLGPKYQNGEKYTKLPQNISNGRKIDQMVIKYTKIFHSKTLRNLPKLGFLVWKQTIWQPCLVRGHSTKRAERVKGRKKGAKISARSASVLSNVLHDKKERLKSPIFPQSETVQARSASYNFRYIHRGGQVLLEFRSFFRPVNLRAVWPEMFRENTYNVPKLTLGMYL